jgi:Domain of unknown function (DUF6398)
MMIDLSDLEIPAALRQAAGEIIAITDAVCLAVLDEEYADLARQAVAKLARQVNFLFDPASQPHATADQLSEAFGLAKGTIGSKAKHVRDLLQIGPFAPEFQRAELAARNPMMWFIEVDGLIMDARSLPLHIQVEAFERGLIPYVPALSHDSTA